MATQPQVHYTRPEFSPGDIRRYDPPRYMDPTLAAQVVALGVYSARISANTQGRNPWTIYWTSAALVLEPLLTDADLRAKMRDLFQSVHCAAVRELVAEWWPAVRAAV